VTCLGKPHSENWSKAKVKLARVYEHLKDLGGTSTRIWGKSLQRHTSNANDPPSQLD
jgi:hypothetical protein